MGRGKDVMSQVTAVERDEKEKEKKPRLRARKSHWVVVSVAASRVLSVSGGFLTVIGKVGIILAGKVMRPNAFPAFQASCLLTLAPLKSENLLVGPRQVANILKPLSFPMLGLTLSAPLIQIFFPDLWRTLCYWRRLLRIYIGYMQTKFSVSGKPLEERKKRWERRHEWGGEKVYRMVLEMSGFYVKSAQVLASKSDFMPEPWTRRLSALFDNAPPRSFQEVSHSIRSELRVTEFGLSLGKGEAELEEAFLEIDKNPLASASIAQVHRALLPLDERYPLRQTLIDGQKSSISAVVKIQHLGMAKLMDSDLRNIGRVAKFLKNQLPFDLTAIVKEIQTTIPLEFDFLRELEFMECIGRNLEASGIRGIVCPKPFRELCSHRMIVMQKLEGIPFTQILASQQISAETLKSTRSAFRSLLEAYGQMLLVDGIFHADPHPGNLLLLVDGNLGLIDFGQCKELAGPTRLQLAALILSLVEGDLGKIALRLTEAGMTFGGKLGQDGEANGGNSGKNMDETLSKMAYMMFDTRNVPEALVSPLSQESMLQKNPLTGFNQSMWLVVRAVLLLRGLCHSLQMDISTAVLWKPYAVAALNHSHTKLS